MSEDDYRKIFVAKLNYYMKLNGKSQKDLMNDLHLSSATISSWCTGKKLPRMGKIQMLADYFGIEKSNLLEDKSDRPAYYTNPDTAHIAQQIYEDKDMRILFDAAKDAKPEDLKLAADMLKRLKGVKDD